MFISKSIEYFLIIKSIGIIIKLVNLRKNKSVKQEAITSFAYVAGSKFCSVFISDHHAGKSVSP